MDLFTTSNKKEIEDNRFNAFLSSTIRTTLPVSALATFSLMGVMQAHAKSSGVNVTATQYGKKWPFIVNKGTVDRFRHTTAIFKANGHIYQLNGVAANIGYDSIDPIWKDNPDIPSKKLVLPDTPIDD